MRGRAMQGWLRVDADGVGTKRGLEPWVRRGVAHARSLPPKGDAAGAGPAQPASTASARQRRPGAGAAGAGRRPEPRPALGRDAARVDLLAAVVAGRAAGAASSPQSSWRRTIGGPSGPARWASPQRMSATIAGKRSRPGVREPVLVAVGVARVGHALEQPRVDERPQAGRQRRPRDRQVAGELPEAADAEERLAQDQQRPALADEAQRPARPTPRRTGARGRPGRPWFAHCTGAAAEPLAW